MGCHSMNSDAEELLRVNVASLLVFIQRKQREVDEARAVARAILATARGVGQACENLNQLVDDCPWLEE